MGKAFKRVVVAVVAAGTFLAGSALGVGVGSAEEDEVLFNCHFSGNRVCNGYAGPLGFVNWGGGSL